MTGANYLNDTDRGVQFCGRRHQRACMARSVAVCMEARQMYLITCVLRILCSLTVIAAHCQEPLQQLSTLASLTVQDLCQHQAATDQ